MGLSQDHSHGHEEGTTEIFLKELSSRQLSDRLAVFDEKRGCPSVYNSGSGVDSGAEDREEGKENNVMAVAMRTMMSSVCGSTSETLG